MQEGNAPISERSNEESDSPVMRESSVSLIGLIKVRESMASKMESKIKEEFRISLQYANDTVPVDKYLT